MAGLSGAAVIDSCYLELSDGLGASVSTGSNACYYGAGLDRQRPWDRQGLGPPTGSGRTRQALGDEAGAFAIGNASERGTPFHQSCSYMSNL